MYEKNYNIWDEVMRNIAESERRTLICQDMFGQDDLRGLTPEQQDLFWASV